MPAGCEFICKNKECVDFNKGFNITAPWPMAKAELVISNLKMHIKAHADCKEELIKLRNQGRENLVMILPNQNKLPISAYRVNLWSPAAKCIWMYEVEIQKEETVEQSIEKNQQNGKLPQICPKTGEKLLSFSEVVADGINCPSCNQKMQEDRWYSNDS